MTYRQAGGDMTTTQKFKQYKYIMTKVHQPPAGRSFKDEHGNIIKPASTDSYNMYKGYTIKRHQLANSYLTKLCPSALKNTHLLYLCALTILTNQATKLHGPQSYLRSYQFLS